MVLSSLFVAAVAASASALSIPATESEELYTIELAPGETKVVTEAEKWALRAEGQNFFDVTDFDVPTSDLVQQVKSAVAVSYPSAMGQTSAVKALLPKLDKSVIQSNLQTFSDFQNRYYRSTYGQQSSEWLLQQVQAIIDASDAAGVTAEAFDHTFVQSSVIAKIPGKSDKTVVIGAHQDSINLLSPRYGRAPGADDDGSGTMTTLEAFRALLTDPTISSGSAANTLEFHWYAAEEGGLLGSQDIFTAYSSQGRDVVAMLQQDMTGYVKPGTESVVGVITDYVNSDLTTFVIKVIDAYCDIPYVETQCGYACSDHASANKAGYPSAFVFESAFENDNPKIHTAQDTVDLVDFDHVLEHAKLTTGFAYELAFASL